MREIEYFIYKNLDLHSEWMKYVFENPDVLDSMPEGAALVLLPEDDMELYSENHKMMMKLRKKGTPVFVVKMKSPQKLISSFEVIAA